MILSSENSKYIVCMKELINIKENPEDHVDRMANNRLPLKTKQYQCLRRRSIDIAISKLEMGVLHLLLKM